MKVLFFCRAFPPDIGGMQKSNYEIAKCINELDHNLDVLTIDKDKDHKEFDKKQDFRIERVFPFKKVKGKVNYLNIFPKFLVMFLSYLKLAKKLNAEEYDKIIITGYYPKEVFGLFPVKFLTDGKIITITSVPKIHKTRDTIIEKIRHLISKRRYKNSDTTVFVSKSTRNEIFEHFGRYLFRDKGNHVIYRTVDDKFIEEGVDERKLEAIIDKHNIDKDKKIILSVSRIEKKKGIDSTLKALKKYKEEGNDDFHYLIVGDGNYLPQIKEMAKDLDLEEHVTSTGYIDFDNVIHYYDLCDIFILPSRRKISESFGRVFAEASARGKPVIGNNTGGVREVIDHEKTGFLVDPNKTEKICERISELLTENELRKRLGKNGREKVKETFTSEELKEDLQEILKN